MSEKPIDNPFKNIQVNQFEQVKQKVFNYINTDTTALANNRAVRYLVRSDEAAQSRNIFEEAEVHTYKKSKVADYTRLGTDMADTCILYSTVDPSKYIKFDDYLVRADTEIKIVRTLPVRGKNTVKEWTAINDVAVSIDFAIYEDNELATKQLTLLDRIIADNAPIQIQSEYLLAKGVQYIVVERFSSTQVTAQPWEYKCSLEGYSTQLIDLLKIG